ncbi:DUF4352 domain-containing protein [Melioribacteraceae bacterium 4301-Me]|uniref:DUF4352 domain-containing protein n=1 Tax=Pyranulibacter aquaticus TaxID=3163344 RepID=UPI003597AE37
MKKPLTFFSFLIVLFLLSTVSNAQLESSISGSKAVFKVVKIVDNYVSENQFVKPDEGKKYIAFEIVVDNTKGSKSITVPSMMIKLKDKEGYEYSIDMISAMIKPSFEGTADAGDLTRGWIGFEVPKSTKLDDLKIAYRGFADKTNWLELKKFKTTK